jgi:hypothetical protein
VIAARSLGIVLRCNPAKLMVQALKEEVSALPAVDALCAAHNSKPAVPLAGQSIAVSGQAECQFSRAEVHRRRPAVAWTFDVH